MERIVTLHIEKLPEGLYLATSDDVQGLIAEGRTIQETIEIARDVAKTLIDLRSEPNDSLANTVGSLPVVRESFDYPLIINA